jgi:pimeloyl-ACP methyl ester carboxylesterase
MRFVTARDGTELYLKDWGHGRPIILLHGWPLSADTFDELALALANAGMRAISYDRRGFGRSAQPWSGYDYDTLADDLASVIETTGARDVTLLGFSMGGGEVARYMSRHGGAHVRQAVLVASVVPYMLKTADNPHGVDQSVFDAMAGEIQSDRAKFWSTFFKQFYGVGMASHPVSDEVLEWSRVQAMQASLKATLACAQAFATTDFRKDVATFNLPTLVIHGTDDKTVPIDIAGRRAASMIRGSRLIEYDGAPHGLLASHGAQLASDVLAFVSEAERTPRLSDAVSR